ncbi:MAG: hypothetical protein E7481_00355 [Ruminococcaceae bacterium]|nr:hypothetical protein [Oscillospiraceae bacterium]
MSLTFSPFIPAYDGGKPAANLYNAGNMITDDEKDFTPEDCPMQLITETNEAEFDAYIEKLLANGFKIVFENKNDSVSAKQLKKGDVILYVYISLLVGEVRITEDRAGVTVPEFTYKCGGDNCEIYQYGLWYHPTNGHSETETNCGMFYIVKLADNSLFMIDGGDLFQCSVEAVQGMYDFIHQITGAKEDEQIRISAWYFTHAHNDHMSACIRLLRTYPGKFNIERVMFNFPSAHVRRGNHETFVLKEALREFCPDVKQLKLQTGEKFTLGNAEFEVFYTQQDAVTAEEPVTYSFLDFNCTSPIIKMTVNGKSVMWLGDTNVECEALMTKISTREMFKSDVVQIAHHCFNFLTTLYDWIDADYAMLPNSYYGGHAGSNKDKLQDVIDHLPTEDNLWYGDKTTGFRFENGEYKVILERPIIGRDHDGIDFYGNYTSFEERIFNAWYGFHNGEGSFYEKQLGFDLVYDGDRFMRVKKTVEKEEKDNTVTTVYTFEDGIKVTNILTKHGDAYEWVNWLENPTDEPSKIFSNIRDCNVILPMPYEAPAQYRSFQPEFEDITAVYAPKGSDWSFEEFTSFPDRKKDNHYEGHLPVTAEKRFSSSGGRSSQGNAPFFNIHKDGKGYILAIGWSGQWNCSIKRYTNNVSVKTKIENTNFRLLPGEKIRTSSIVIMPYEGTVTESQNKWRKLVKENFSLIGKEGRDKYGPLCASVWGGMTSKTVLERIDTLNKNNIPYDYIWMDAGWYGGQTAPTPDEFEGDWPEHTGDWRVSPIIHPNGLKDVSKAIHDAGKKFLLWFECERVRRSTPIAKEHPEYFIFPDWEDEENLLLNLGNPDAWQYCFDTVSGMIEDIGIDCFRVDFNFNPLDYWKIGEDDDRKGINEIKYVNGLYKLWDALLEKFPHLLIDNCASGGRRIDIETLRRSIPLWRSDYQCPANHIPEGVQCHNLSFNNWMPYSGSGTGRIYDTYRVRSAYSTALNYGYAFSERENFGDDPEKIEWLREILNEYLTVRPYMSEDFYPLTQVSDRTDIWSARQFDRPEQGDGIILAFRRDNSPYETASFTLGGIDENAVYIFTDADTQTKTALNGSDLIANGFHVTIAEKHGSKIIFYKKA